MELLKKRTIGTIEDGALRRAAVACKGTTVVGADAFHPRVPLDLSDECCGRIFILLVKVNVAGYGPRMPAPLHTL